MARPVRVEFPGAVYLVTSRGRGGAPVFAVEEDRKRFLDILGQVVSRFGWKIYAYCLLEDSYQLLFETPQPNLSRGMRQLGGVYTQRYNKIHGHDGPLFQGRYKSVLVEKGEHLKEISRFIALGPVRAGLSTGPEFYIYSSHRPLAGLARVPEWLESEGLLEFFGGDEGAPKRYAEFVYRGGAKDTPLSSVKKQLALGGEEHVAKSVGLAKKKLGKGRQSGVKKKTGAPPLSRIFSKKLKNKADRNQRVFKAHVEYGYTLEQIAEVLGLHYATVSRIVKKVEESAVK